MNNKELFKEAMHEFAGRADSDKYYNCAERRKKRLTGLRTGAVCAAVFAVVVVVISFGTVLYRTQTMKRPGVDNGTLLVNSTDNPLLTDSTTQSSSSTDTQTTDEISDDVDASDGAQSGDSPNHSVEYRLITITDHDEYVKYVNDHKEDAEFIDVMSFRDLGEFDGFIILSNARAGDRSQYRYDLIDGSGSKLSVTITDLTSREIQQDQPAIDAASCGNDLRGLMNSVSGAVDLGGTKYVYVNGKLLCIDWVQGIYHYYLRNLFHYYK